MVGKEAQKPSRVIPQPRFERFMAIDWSGAVGPRQPGIAVAICSRAGGAPVLMTRTPAWSREDVLALLANDLPDDTLVGLDLGISLPYADCGAFFPGWPGTPAHAPDLWALIDTVCSRDANLSVSSFVDHPEFGRYFRRHGGREGDRFLAAGVRHRRGRFRITEAAQERLGCKPYSNFNLVGAAQVGKSSLSGMRMLHRLKGRLPIWPIEPLPPTGSVITEIYTAIAAVDAGRRAGRSKIRSFEDLDAALTALGSPATRRTGPVDDHSSDALLTAAWLRASAGRQSLWHPTELTVQIARTEGWTFGAL